MKIGMTQQQIEKLNSDVQNLPDWARAIIAKADKTALSAYWYRRELVAFQSALHALCKDDADGLKFEDQVKAAAARVHKELDAIMDERDRAERIAVRKRVVKDLKAWREGIAKALKRRGRKPVNGSFNPSHGLEAAK